MLAATSTKATPRPTTRTGLDGDARALLRPGQKWCSRVLVARCGLAALTLLLTLLATATPAPARGPLQIGIADDGVLLGDPAEADEAVASWQRLGIDTARIQVSWARVAPAPDYPLMPIGFNPYNAGDPGYHWGVIDAAVRRVVDAGIQPILMIDGPPPLWSSSRPAAGNQRFKPQSWQFAAFASAVAGRYQADVATYILWNEPNLPLWLQPQADCVARKCHPVSADTYRFMVRSAYPAIHAADPDARVLIGALAPRGGRLVSRNANMRPLEFLRAFGCVDTALRPIRSRGCKGFQPAIADGFAYHAHSTKLAPDQPYEHPDDADIASLPRVEQLLDSLQEDGRIIGTSGPLGIWLDEYAYQTNPPDRERGVSPGRQDRYLQQAAYIAWRDPRVQMIGQYAWRDEPVDGGRSYTGWQSGLFFSDGRPKPALAHFANPFWVDVRRSTLWGQVRPGGAHTVEVQVRPPGRNQGWSSLGRLATAGDGTWVMRTPITPFATYRAISEDGRTSAAVVAAPSNSDPNEAPPDEAPTEVTPVERRTVAVTPRAPVPRSFAGLSVEYRSVRDFLGTGGLPNPVFAALSRTLEREGSGPPPLRFGGDSTDQTWWNPAYAPRPAGITTDLDPAWLTDVRTWLSAVKSPLTFGLNLGLNDPARAAELARAVAGGVPRDALSGFQIGNEPDLYPTARRYKVGPHRLARIAKRPLDYDYAQLRRELEAHIPAISAAAPGIPLQSSPFAAAAWNDHAQDVLGIAQGAFSVYAAHAYALQTCNSNARRLDRAGYIPALLAGRPYTALMARMEELVAVATAQGADVRVDELNTAICGGLLGVSDTFASAIWGTDVLFGLAQAGVRRAHFHTWTGARYAPVEFGSRPARVRPLFYAMLLFNRATPDGSRLLPVGPNPPGARLKTWATVDGAGTRRVVVINKDPKGARKVILRVAGAGRVARVERLQARSLRSTGGVTLGGQSYGTTTKDGVLRGDRVVERVPSQGGAFTLAMPPGSAALMTIGSAAREGPPLPRRAR